MPNMNVPESLDVEGHRARAKGGGVVDVPCKHCGQRAAVMWQIAASRVVNSSMRTRTMLVLIGQLAMLAIGLWLGGKL